MTHTLNNSMNKIAYIQYKFIYLEMLQFANKRFRSSSIFTFLNAKHALIQHGLIKQIVRNKEAISLHTLNFSVLCFAESALW